MGLGVVGGINASARTLKKDLEVEEKYTDGRLETITLRVPGRGRSRGQGSVKETGVKFSRNGSELYLGTHYIYTFTFLPSVYFTSVIYFTFCHSYFFTRENIYYRVAVGTFIFFEN